MNKRSKKLIAGNWKMNGSLAEAEGLVREIEAAVGAAPDILEKNDLLVCPPALHVGVAVSAADSVAVGGQDCSAHDSGAYTGQVSAPMFKDSGCGYVILGHSERREYQDEKDALIKEKMKAAREAGLVSILCVGETDKQRQSGRAKEVVGRQLKAAISVGFTADNLVVAYEPVWAIGTGNTAQPSDVAEMHDYIRETLQDLAMGANDIRILYGGSMKPENAKELLATSNVDGGLIGGASLKAESFINIAKAAF